MTLWRKLVLHYQHFTADGTVPTICKSGLRAGRFNCLIMYFGMTRRRDFNICGIITAGTGVISVPSRLSTGRGLCLMVYNVMA